MFGGDKGEVVGIAGVVHPEVLGHFGVDKPCAILEMCIERFV